MQKFMLGALVALLVAPSALVATERSVSKAGNFVSQPIEIFGEGDVHAYITASLVEVTKYSLAMQINVCTDWGFEPSVMVYSLYNVAGKSWRSDWTHVSSFSNDTHPDPRPSWDLSDDRHEECRKIARVGHGGRYLVFLELYGTDGQSMVEVDFNFDFVLPHPNE